LTSIVDFLKIYLEIIRRDFCQINIGLFPGKGLILLKTASSTPYQPGHRHQYSTGSNMGRNFEEEFRIQNSGFRIEDSEGILKKGVRSPESGVWRNSVKRSQEKFCEN